MKALKTALIALALPIFFQNGIKGQVWKQQPASISTRWSKKVDIVKVLPEYPRPQLQRKYWQSLNGLWEYCITPKTASNFEKSEGKILVPYPIESLLSGVKRPLKANELLWYKRVVSKPRLGPGERLILNFGAVDFEATVYLNGKEIGKHSGGYQNFSFDVTDNMISGDNVLTVKVSDPTDQGPNPHGKQVLAPIGIMYTASSGIWQTVWLETVPEDYVKDLKITQDVDAGEVTVQINGSANAAVEVSVFDGKKQIALSRTPRNDGKVILTIPNAKLWSPDDPFLYSLEVTLGRDKVKSYFGMRKIEVKKDEKGIDRIFLNNKYTYNLGTLDQGFWPDGLYTAPTDEALAFDIKAIKAMGFNTIRKHIKIEPSRWYYWADRLGMLVWQDMVNPGNDTPEGRSQFEKENKENIQQLYNHPSIITWVLFNEKWGQYDQERLTKELKQLDPTRLVNGHSGEILYVNNVLRSPSPNAWVGADMTDVHAYPNPGHIKFENGKAAVLGEFGGIGVPIEGHLWDDLQEGWGYDGVVTPTILKRQYLDMVDSLKRLEAKGLTASIYTQPFDVETEQNGLITYDRALIKIPVEIIRGIHAKLWPATKSYQGAKDITIKNADSVTKTYVARLQEYQGGKREQSFLRSLAIMAKKQKDDLVSEAVTKDYIDGLGSSINETEANFIAFFTDKSTDPGFTLLMDWAKRHIREGQRNTVSGKLQDIIFKEQVKDYLGDQPNWEKIEEIIVNNKPLDGELIRGMSVIYYLNAAARGKQNATKNLVNAALKYDELYDFGMYNDWAWQIFLHSSERTELENALIWSKKSITRNPNHPNYIDTYANILYKLGRTTEAIEWELKALAIDPQNAEFQETLGKMKSGKPSWPIIKIEK